MKKIFLLFFTFISFLEANTQTNLFDELLQTHVSKDGIVDYKSFKKDLPKLQKYISYLQKTTLDSSWSDNKKKAFWINAYNAYTIKLILKNHPLKSIIDIKQKEKSAWEIPFSKIGGEIYTLDEIEHKILRKQLFDARIHVGVNCASISCPKLERSAFTEDNIEKKLSSLMKSFINDSSRNKISSNEIQISEIFKWFKDDFTKESSLIDYLNKYSEVEINSNTKISYLKYNWSLNGK